MIARLGLISAFLFFAGAASAAEPALPAREGDIVVRDFAFGDGGTLKELRLHYTTLGTLRRDAKGHARNAVMILHGTGGSGQQFLRPQFAGVLFAKGGLLDPAKYFIILPDGIGHGKSSKPSDGLRAAFPHYDYDDMAAGQMALLKGLGVDHLRLILGTSMGCMHAFVWGETHPDFADALMPLACLPVEIAGRNRLWRKMAMDAITADPAWDGGNYKTPPTAGLRTATDLLLIAGSAPIPLQKELPTRTAADDYLAKQIPQRMAGVDANDMLYQVDASRNYNPEPKLESITAEMMWVNSADDFINPPELGIAERDVQHIKHGEFVLIPASENGHGHGTHTWAALWQDRLAALLKRSEKQKN